jgi:glycosidase
MFDRTGAAVREFHVARVARDRYQFDDSIFTYTGNAVFANFHAARSFAQKMNQKRDLVSFPEQAVRPGQISAMGLIDEISHIVFRRYCQLVNPNLLQDALAWLGAQVGADAVDSTLRQFCDEFPPVAVYRREATLDAYLQGATGGESHREAALEELLMLWINNKNPAFAPFLELFDDDGIERQTSYPQVIPSLYEFFGSQPAPFGGALGQNIIDLLRAPALAAPHSLEGQIAFILERWGAVVGREFLFRLLTSLDIIKEEGRAFLTGGGPGDISAAQMSVAEFGGLDAEPERFSADREWMPRCVLLAKNAFVWLDQLTKQYGRPINTLDQIPDVELDALAARGFTGLWLIGLWERSAASKRIKQIMGNPDAVASAYSLYDYSIAYDLGGEEAMRNLRDRCWQRGIRMASDMVPNHVGIDGRWVIEHPDWFVSLDYPPFPSYTFDGVDLSSDERVGIFIEDHYYSRSDAAVVFKRVDRWSGSTKYVYHGNDGTSMPWNDTAQLNYLNPEVREAVIQTILHVARQFPIIRFDAAMTLAKRHFQRLWFPEPGSGGDIPSRAEHGLTKAQFDALMPQEFWREVVDRCAVEAPDTLLLAEAFWLMEGYFVRTLGMHRVYNSAFMVMLRDEDNAKYRQVLKNTLEFDPEIMRRYVNFMNNPDERTAVDQFGKDDKYFGVATLLVTLPGLPMIGHGQVEGYTEKYGMEYRRAYWDEKPDGWLIGRHEREIFPLMHRRYLFAGVDLFLLYDFFAPEGHVVEDVYAFSNGYGHERALVVYHNRFASTRGWVKTSVAYAEKRGDDKVLVQRSLAEGLGLQAGENNYVIFRDSAAGVEYIRHSREIRDMGLYVELGAYTCYAFVDFREVADDAEGRYGQLAAFLGGRGVPNVEDAMRELFLQPIHTPLKALINAELFRRIMAGTPAPAAEDAELDEIAALESEAPAGAPTADLVGDVRVRLASLFDAIRSFTGTPADDSDAELADLLCGMLTTLTTLQEADDDQPAGQRLAAADLSAFLGSDVERWGTALSWLFVHRLGQLTAPGDDGQQSRSLIDEWMLGRVISAALRDLGLDDGAAQRAVAAVRLLTDQQGWHAVGGPVRAARLIATLVADNDAQRLIGINRYQDVLWFQQEGYEAVLNWLLLAAALAPADDAAAGEESLVAAHGLIAQLRAAEAQAGYQVEKLVAALRAGKDTTPPEA